MSNNTLGSLLLIAIALVIIIGVASLPDCKRNEVMVRGTWGMVCVEGHR